MAEFAVSVVDPGGFHWAQLLEFHRPVDEWLTTLVRRLGLPVELSYDLLLAGRSQPLDQRLSLFALGVSPGAVLHLRPVRDPLLNTLLEQLYEETADRLADQLAEEANQALARLDRLDPAYPDPQGLRRRLGRIAPPPGATAGPPPGARPPSPIGPAPSPAQPYQASATAPAKSGSNLGCILAAAGGCLVLVLLAAGVITVLVVGGLGTALTGGNGSGSGAVLGTGDVQVTLRWDSAADLDLHVIDPAGEEIWFSNPESASGGQLDVDANPACEDLEERPVENIFWPAGAAPNGRYEVHVSYFEECDNSGPTDYQLTVLVDGVVVDQVSGALSAENDSTLASTFTR